MDNEIEYWDCEDDAETLYYESKDEAIESYLDNIVDDFPDEIYVYGYAKIEPKFSVLTGYVLEKTLEWLDEEYGPEDDYTEPTDTMAEAEDVFIDAILKEYVSRRYQVVHKEVVYVEDWVRENRPDWLPDLTA